jgi:hypothetical protein
VLTKVLCMALTDVRHPPLPTIPSLWSQGDRGSGFPIAVPFRYAAPPAPFFHAASRKIRRELYEAYRHFLAAFRDAATRLRVGERDVISPSASFPPVAPWVDG